jgi:hypothetical protein
MADLKHKAHLLASHGHEYVVLVAPLIAEHNFAYLAMASVVFLAFVIFEEKI